MTPEVVRAAGELDLVPRWLTPFFRLSETLPGERVFRRFYEPFAAAGKPVFVQLMGRRAPLLAAAGELMSAPNSIFSLMESADLRFPDVEDAEGHLHENPVYFVLNLARAVAYCRKGKVLSKKEGGEWALRHMSTDHQRVIQAALNAYETGLGMSYDAAQAEDFCDEALEEIRKAE